MSTKLIGLLHSADRAIYGFDIVACLGCVVLLFVAASGLIRWRMKASRPAFPIVFFGSIATALVLVLAVGTTVQLERVAANAEMLRLLSGSISQVIVDGRASAHPADVVASLRSLSGLHPDHSEPGTVHHVEIVTGSGTVIILARQDSMDRRNYWIYYAGFYLTRSNDIGHALVDPTIFT